MLLAIYALLNFISAALIFFIQPLAAKSVLPVLGGAPFVWNGCMVFFQATLLTGYIYAHLLNTYTSAKNNAIIHLSLFLVAAALTLPLHLDALAAENGLNGQPLFRLIYSLLITLGLPFFIISATSPLTQSWFIRTQSRKEPYLLYAASNFGSFVGLLAYPLLFEPHFHLHTQARLVDCGFAVLFILLLAAALYMLRSNMSAVKTSTLAASPVTAREKLTWIALAFIPGSLLYSVTSYVITDIASVPLLWVIPLAIYILSLVLVFAGKGKIFSNSRLLHFSFAAAILLSTQIFIFTPLAFLAIHFIALFIFCMVCHRKLYEKKPRSDKNLTSFYIYLSLGGVLGGLFNTFLAPNLFNSVIEYPLFIFLSLFVWLDFSKFDYRSFAKDLLIPLIIFNIFLIIFIAVPSLGLLRVTVNNHAALNLLIIFQISLAVLMFAAIIRFQHKTLPMLSCILVLFICAYCFFHDFYTGKIIFQKRNIFGVNRVSYDQENNLKKFIHGTTIHGLQSLNEEKTFAATTYYWPLKNVFAVADQKNNSPVAVIGQGIGTVACYIKPGQAIDIFEIDQLIAHIADKYFTYMRRCPGSKKVIIGDGRINILQQPDKKYGLIIVDAFSSDSVPVHLITREAVKIYTDKLQDNGLLAFHITNRFVDLLPVLSAISGSLDLPAVYGNFAPKNADGNLFFVSTWVVIGKNPKMLKALSAADGTWQPVDSYDERYLWRDDYSNIIRSLIL